MSDHQISPSGLSIECHAAPNADCRTRPNCDAEGWGENHCIGHDPGHPKTGGNDCWKIDWINPVDLWDSWDGPGDYPGAIPGRAVQIAWEGDYCTWEYEEPVQ